MIMRIIIILIIMIISIIDPPFGGVSLCTTLLLFPVYMYIYKVVPRFSRFRNCSVYRYFPSSLAKRKYSRRRRWVQGRKENRISKITKWLHSLLLSINNGWIMETVFENLRENSDTFRRIKSSNIQQHFINRKLIYPVIITIRVTNVSLHFSL